MSEIKEKTENPEIKECIYKFVPQMLNSVRTFKKVFGKNFASKKIKQNIITVYTNEDGTAKGCSGYQCGEDKSITLCYTGEN